MPNKWSFYKRLENVGYCFWTWSLSVSDTEFNFYCYYSSLGILVLLDQSMNSLKRGAANLHRDISKWEYIRDWLANCPKFSGHFYSVFLVIVLVGLFELLKG